MNDLNKNENDYNKNIENKLININNNIEEMNKKINETKDELKIYKNKEEKYINELDTIKNNVNAVLNNGNNYNNNNNNQEIFINSDDIKLNKEINNISNQINNDNNNYNPNSNSIEKDNNNNNTLNNNASSKAQFNSEINNDNDNDIQINQNQLNLILKRFKNKENLIIKENKKLKLNFYNNINNANSTFNNFHKNMKLSFDKNIIKPINNNNNNNNKKQFFNFKKNFGIKIDEIDFYQNKKTQKEKPNINLNPNRINKSSNKKNKFPMIKEKIVDNNFIIFQNLQKNKNSNKKNKNNNYSIDKETGVGCNIVKLSIEDNSITPYNTNGLIKMASNQLLNRKLNKSEEGMSFSFDNIFSNIYQIQTKRKNILTKKPQCNKTIQTFHEKNNIDVEKVLNTIDNNIKKEFSKTINNNISFDNEIIRYNLNKNKK